jgi:nitrogen fixation/metabolism regulation signal transduction histidine kinase
MGEKIKRRNYLVKKGMQLRYTGIIVLSSLFVTLVMVLYMAWNVDQLTNLATRWEFSPQELSMWKNAFIIKLGLLLVGLLALNAFVSILVSHKVAGVVFRLEKIIDSVAVGNFPPPMHIRKGDELIDLVDKFNKMIQNLKNKTLNTKEAIEKIQGLKQDLTDKIKQGSIPASELTVLFDKLKQLENTLERG